ncbi:hypothetical protein JCM1840_006817 [Sporobolomyces johnsonii]
MLDRLPCELILHILELGVPPTHSATAYSTRQTYLHNCCLVSRRLRWVAQPLLFAVFEASSALELDSFLRIVRVMGLGDRVQAAALSYPVGKWVTDAGTAPKDLVQLVQACPVLEQLNVYGAITGTDTDTRGFDLTVLAGFQKLCSLTLSFRNLTLSNPFVLPHLVDLTLSHTHTTPETLAAALNPSTLPSLCALAFRTTSNNAGAFSQPIETLCPQLHMLSRDAIDSDGLADGTFASFLPWTLVNCSLSLVGSRAYNLKRVHHLHLLHDPYDQAVDAAPDLVSVETELPLCTLYLSPNLCPDRSLPVALARARDDLLTACIAREIEVCWEHIRDGLDSAISPSFWHKARAIRASEGTGVGDRE